MRDDLRAWAERVCVDMDAEAKWCRSMAETATTEIVFRFYGDKMAKFLGLAAEGRAALAKEGG